MKYALFLLTAGLALAQSPRGIWDASVIADTREIGFQMRFEGAGQKLRAAVLDGDRPIWSTSAAFKDNRLLVKWDFYDAPSKLHGIGPVARCLYPPHPYRPGQTHLLRRPAQPAKAAKQEPSPFSGDWILTPADGRAGMKARFQMSGGKLTGTILRIDGDFGTLAGAVSGNQATLTHFDLVRATQVRLSVDASGNLSGVIDGRTRFAGVRDGASMPDPSQVTSVRDPKEPFQFTAKDLDGNPVTLADPRFKGKAIVMTIMGSWCPNCHDEAPFLAELHKRYGPAGLEVVALALNTRGSGR